jgi:hypothetical protein
MEVKDCQSFFLFECFSYPVCKKFLNPPIMHRCPAATRGASSSFQYLSCLGYEKFLYKKMEQEREA